MTPSPQDRDTLFKSFGRAWFKRDVEALYEVVTEDFAWRSLDETGNGQTVSGKEAVGAKLKGGSATLTNVRFEDVFYHHAPDATFMTFRLTATNAETGADHEEHGIERYTFKDGRIAVKDVYRKPA